MNKALALLLPEGTEDTGHIWDTEASDPDAAGRLHTFRRGGADQSFIRLDGAFVGPVVGSIDSADRLSTPRTISLAGDASGSALFDGSGDVVLNVVLDPAHVHGIAEVINLQASLNGKADVAHSHPAEDIGAGVLGAGDYTIPGGLIVAGDFSASNIDIPGTLDVTGAVALSSTLVVTSTSTLTGGARIKAAAFAGAPFHAQVGDGTEDVRLLLWTNSEFALAVRNGAATNGRYYLGASAAVNPDLLFLNNTGIERARLTDAGVLLVGTTTATNAVAGDARMAGALWIGDGVTAPTAQTGFAAIYVDAADGDLKVRFGDGTIKTIVTDT